MSKNGCKIVDDTKVNMRGVVQEGKSKKIGDDIKEEPMVKKTIEFFDGLIVNVKGG